jgi:hypothetical protein
MAKGHCRWQSVITTRNYSSLGWTLQRDGAAQCPYPVLSCEQYNTVNKVSDFARQSWRPGVAENHGTASGNGWGLGGGFLVDTHETHDAIISASVPGTSHPHGHGGRKRRGSTVTFLIVHGARLGGREVDCWKLHASNYYLCCNITSLEHDLPME